MKTRLLASIALSAACLWLAARGVDFGATGAILSRLSWVTLVYAIVWIVALFWLRAVRWRLLLRPVSVSLRTSDAFYGAVVGAMANNVLPARLGELARAFAIGERSSISKSAAFATIVLERIYDGLALVIVMGAIAGGGRHAFPGWLVSTTYAMVAFFAAALLCIVWLHYDKARALRLLDLVTRPLPSKLRQVISGTSESFATGLQTLGSARDSASTAALSVAVWFGESYITHLCLLSLGIDVGFWAAAFLTVFISIATMVPAAPGNVGTVQLASVMALGVLGVEQANALAFGLLFQFIIFFPITPLGIFLLLRRGVSLLQLRSGVVEGSYAK